MVNFIQMIESRGIVDILGVIPVPINLFFKELDSLKELMAWA